VFVDEDELLEGDDWRADEGILQKEWRLDCWLVWILEGRNSTGGCDWKIGGDECWDWGFCCAEKRRDSVCSVDGINVEDWADRKVGCIRWTSDSDGRLSLCLFLVLDENSEGVEIWFGWKLSMTIMLEERGDERRELELEISESDRFRLRTIVEVWKLELDCS
jgi:hypothetical protein